MMVAQEKTEHEMLHNNRIVKNEVIDMADMVEELQDTVKRQDQKIDQMMQMISVLVQN